MRKNIAVIGRRGHAGRIIKILKKNKKVKKIGIYHKDNFEKQIGKLNYFNNFKNITDYDSVIISSPNYTHTFYLKKLINFKGEILCEKPAGSVVDNSNILSRFYKKKKINLSVNYNLLNSELFKEIKRIINKEKFGKIIFFQIIKNTGLAFNKKKYLKNWRSNTKLSSGVLELQTVHYINFFLHMFKKLKIHSFKKSKFSNFKNVNCDSLILNFESKKKYISIVNSYSSVFKISVDILLTNSKVNYDGKYLKIYYPRDTFDKNNRFTEPKLYFKKRIVFDEMWNKSLHASLNLFINDIKKENERHKLKNSLETLRIFKKINK